MADGSECHVYCCSDVQRVDDLFCVFCACGQRTPAGVYPESRGKYLLPNCKLRVSIPCVLHNQLMECLGRRASLDHRANDRAHGDVAPIWAGDNRSDRAWMGYRGKRNFGVSDFWLRRAGN